MEKSTSSWRTTLTTSPTTVASTRMLSAPPGPSVNSRMTDMWPRSHPGTAMSRGFRYWFAGNGAVVNEGVEKLSVVDDTAAL